MFVAGDSRSGALISIVTPAYNEQDNLRRLYERICAVFDGMGRTFELIIVENGSSDNSLEIIRDLRSRDSRVGYVSLTRNFGHQGGLVAGLEHARGAAIVMMDADLQHPPEIIARMVKLWEEGFDVVYTTKRYLSKQRRARRIADGLFYSVMNKLSGIDLRGQSDFRLIDRGVADILCAMPERNKFLRALTAWVSHRQAAVEYDVSPREAGKSKFRVSHLFKLAIDGIFAFSIVPLRIFTFSGVVVSCLSLAYGLFFAAMTFAARLTGDASLYPQGWATLAVALLFFGGVQLMGIGLLGEYLGRVYDEVKHRPSYVVREQGLGNNHPAPAAGA